MVAADADGGGRVVLADDVTGGDRVRYRGTDRFGGSLSVTDRRIVIRDDIDGDDGDEHGDDGDGDARTGDSGDGDADGRAVPLTVVEELTYRSVDWFTLLLGVGIVAFGLVSIPRHRLGAAAFVLAGAGSLAVTWRRRGRVRIHTHGRPKPVTVYPADPEEFLAAVDASLAGIRSERSPDDGISDDESGPRGGPN
ncbi:hypothetical protein GWK26_00780 [haloarchaeon 3A1-DGR]|nr:hypothetical protein GWK26_00780 [haloarchaeon 3A1-DGR]